MRICPIVLFILIFISALRPGSTELAFFDHSAIVDAQSYYILPALSNDAEIIKFIGHDRERGVEIPKDFVSFRSIESRAPVFLKLRSSQIVYLPRSPPELT